MSDVGVFPQLPGLAWSVSKSPIFQTRVQRTVSGRELRALDYPYPLWQFSLTYEFLRDDPSAGDELRTLMGFLMLCQGAFATFLFEDPSDNRAVGQAIGFGDNIATAFQLGRSFGGFYEPITAPNAVEAVYVDGVVQSPTDYGVDTRTGVLTFAVPPAARRAISLDFTYYFRCRFLDDSHTFENFMHQLWSLKKLSFVSVRS